MKKFMLMLAILFICGIVSADLCIGQLNDKSVLLDVEIYKGYASAKIAFKDVFWNVLYERMKVLVLLFLLCFTPIREKISVILISIFSFIWGFFFMCTCSELGLAGVIVGLTSVLPHGILYGAVFFMMLGKKRYNSYHTKDRVMLSISSYIFMLILFVTGCVLESLVATHFIPWVIRLSQV